MFGLGAKTAPCSASKDEDDPEAFEASLDFKPIVPLPDKVDVVTGEELRDQLEGLTSAIEDLTARLDALQPHPATDP